MKKQYLAVLFISIFAACSGVEDKKEAQGNLTVTNLTSFFSQTVEGGSHSISFYSRHFGAIPFSIEAFDTDGIKEVMLRLRQKRSTVGRFVICADAASSTCTGNTINKDVTVDPAHYEADHGLLEVDLLLLNKNNQQSKVATIKVLNWEEKKESQGNLKIMNLTSFLSQTTGGMGKFILPLAYSTHFGPIPFSIEAFDNNDIKEVKLRLRQNGKTIAHPVICNDESSSVCEGKLIRENRSFNPVDYGAANGALEVDLLLVNEQNQQSQLATLSIVNWERFAPSGTFISPSQHSRHNSAILVSIEAFDDDGFKQIGLTLKENGNPFATLALCDDVSSACSGDRVKKDITVDPVEYGIDNDRISIDLWSIDGQDIYNELATLNLQWGLLEKIRLNGTGITWGGDDVSANNTTCTSNIDALQDCDQGRDAQAVEGRLAKKGAGHAGFDFTKLDSSGNALIKQDATWDDNGNKVDGTKWSCVQDNHTGLIWEVKTNDGGIHDKANRYRWGGKTAIGKFHRDATGDYYDDWDELVDGANAERLCGFNNWRVPEIEELRSIVDYSLAGRRLLAIDQSYFPNTYPYSYWSSSPDSRYSDRAWRLYFPDAFAYSQVRRLGYPVRLVRSGQ